MPVTPLTPPKNYLYTSPGFVSPPGILNTAAPNTPQPTPSVGLINTPQAPAPYTTNPATPKASTAVGYNPVGFSVDKNQTVAGQVDSLIAKDSPLMQQAETRARQKANARGLINSSMAVGAGQAEVMNTALPIAQQDASTYNAAHTNTQNATNAALNFDAAGKNQASQTNAQLGTNVSMQNAEMANKALSESFQAQANYGLATLDANVKISLSNLDTQTKMALTRMENENRTLLQTSQNASAMFNQVATAIANIRGNPNITDKESAIADQLTLLNESMQLHEGITGLKIGQYFQQGGGPGLSDDLNFSQLPLRTDIPNGGHRDNKGNVYDNSGKLMDWRGPEGGNVYMGPTGTIMTDAQAWADAVNGAPRATGNTPAPATSRPGTPAPSGGGVVPTGTVTNPGGTSMGSVIKRGQPIPPATPGYRWSYDGNRAGYVQVPK